MQVKCEVFSRFGNSADFSSGEPIGGVEASTVGADLCVRPSSPERSLFCGRTRRSAPTQATSARQFHSSNAVTSTCRDARLVSSRRASLQGVTCLALMQQGYSFRCCTIRRGDEGKRPLAVGRILAPSRRSKAPNDWGTEVRIRGDDLPWREVGLEL